MLVRPTNHKVIIDQFHSIGYEIDLKDGCILVSNIPYINKDKTIKKGVLVCPLNIIQNNIVQPKDHVMHFIGEEPCDKNGTRVPVFIIGQSHKLSANILSNFTFSNKPKTPFKSFLEKFESYIRLISSYVEEVDENIKPQSFRALNISSNNSSLNYLDTNSTRSSVLHITEKVKNMKIGLIGLGGTGSYILDKLAKNPIEEIHLFDGDDFFQHNAFRSPGAASFEELGESTTKVNYFHRTYSKMHNGLIKHNYYITEQNINELNHLNFVFISIDKGEIKKLIIEHLQKLNIPFIDTGIGVSKINEKLNASIRITSSDNLNKNHIWESKRISFFDPNQDDIYQSNIQIAELNSLNADLAIIKWKKMIGIYSDNIFEYQTIYNIAHNDILNEDYGT
ncbi:ThiF family adenylyltransferase [Wenyingzhuangia aestuarii]|uniref:ThiF family adenylyltransferase n=1 Tax=Wenyingzhuangia aestuarii TaxID=1647582 RepID=UPI00143B84A0|nr:ThiF family adenylyltransferase [Wenyingzhuangia aestuarii]NJB82052.1 hypothetical protein [Wenyingzhuangia aestuarii]